jgi:hypothetical protein
VNSIKILANQGFPSSGTISSSGFGPPDALLSRQVDVTTDVNLYPMHLRDEFYRVGLGNSNLGD